MSTTLTLGSSAGDFGEFIFGQPDLSYVAYPPLLNQVENYRGVQPYEIVAPMLAASGVISSVNQELPIALSWSPKGFAGWYELQIAADVDFASPVVAEEFLTTAAYVWTNAAPGSTYHYRVRTGNDAGESDWAVGSFQTVPPSIQATVPNGGETWQRGLKYFIQWTDNLAENVVIDLFKGGALLKSIATNASTGAYKWEVPLDVAPGNDYSIRISSATAAGLFDLSDTTFSIIDAPVINASSVTSLPDGRVQFNLTAPGATEATVLGSTDLVHWEELAPKVTVTDGNGAFTDETTAGLPYRFYRVRAP